MFVACVSSLFILIARESFAYNILSVLPLPLKSHSIISSSLLNALANKGHNVTVYTTFPQKKQMPNLQEIDISSCVADRFGIEEIENLVDSTLFDDFMVFIETAPTFEELKNCHPLMELLNSTPKFDVLISEPFNSDVISIFSYKFNIPSIYIFTNVLFSFLSERMGSPSNPSYIPSMELGTVELKFFDRLWNVYHYGFYTWFQAYSIRQGDEIIRKLFGPGIPSLMEIVWNTSLILTSSHFSYNLPIPLAPGIIEIGGIHIKNTSRLPKEIEKFINESTHGVVYFSMGSLLQGASFPEEKLNAFLYAFSKIPQRILWKWEGADFPGKSDNIMVSKWMPQRDILAHPNIKLFISHGGLLGTSEAVYEGVPVLGIPVFGDQRNNIKAIEAKGAGEILEYHEISNEVVLEKIQRLINTPKYKENMKQMSARYRDRPMSPTETAVYWTEYVIRHKGAHHLKTAAADMPWYQYLLLDVIAFIIFVFIVVIFILYYTIKVTATFIWNSVVGQTNTGISKSAKKEKKN